MGEGRGRGGVFEGGRQEDVLRVGGEGVREGRGWELSAFSCHIPL